jgi:hypothetical protein
MSNLGYFSAKFRTVSRFAESLQPVRSAYQDLFFIVCGPRVKLCKAQVCWRCMDHGMIIIKLAKSCLIAGGIVKLSER